MYEQYVNSDEQCMNSDFCLYAVNSREITVHVQEKKKKKKKQNVKLKTQQSAQSKHSQYSTDISLNWCRI